MEKLIEALQIFLKYRNLNYPTVCEHDIMYIVDITEEEVSDEDKEKLDKLGFNSYKEEGSWISYRYGSA